MPADQCKRQLITALEEGLKKGLTQGSQDQLIFGNGLEDLADDAGSEVIRAREFLDLLATALARRDMEADSKILRYIRLALNGTSEALARAAYSSGRYFGNPTRQKQRMASASRVVDRWIATRQSEL